MERDFKTLGAKRYAYDFNSHAHVERDDLPLLTNVSNDYFNSHAHVERDDFNGIYGKGTENFNSHAHVERDLCYLYHA